jgi:hypothetical protein
MLPMASLDALPSAPDATQQTPTDMVLSRDGSTAVIVTPGTGTHDSRQRVVGVGHCKN